MKNQVIEVLNEAHGQLVKKYWQEKGLPVTFFMFSFTRENGDKKRYYGVIDGIFDYYSLDQVIRHNAEIITLPENNDFILKEKVMIVWNDDYPERYKDDHPKQYKRVVFAFKNGRYIAWEEAETVEEAKNKTLVSSWKHAKLLSEENSLKQELLSKADELIQKAEELKQQTNKL